MTDTREQHKRRSRARAITLTGILAIVLAALAVPASPAGAAVITVGNGLTTTDLNAVGMSPTSLASALVGPGVTVSNVTYSGANAQAGTIHVVDPAVVSFNDGVILSSGNVADVVGPNKSDSTTGYMAGPGDPQLDALIAGTQTVNPQTYDAASLSFDFVPTGNQVYFTYTFGSDEYLEWVNLFNDVFAFYVNGQNCATVPSGAPVSIDTINSAVNTNLFRDNAFSSPPANPINIESDGLSVEMICSAPVNPGVVNHMKLAIADTSDGVLDSVVMIKAGSLSTTPAESCNNGVDDNGDSKVDLSDPLCQATTTPPVGPGSSGIGSGGNAPPFTGNEGTPIPLDASALSWVATPDTVSTTWTVTGINGTPGTCDVTPATALPLNPDGSMAVVTTICPNEGEYVASVHGWDVENKSSFDYDVDFFVHNAPPAVTITAPTTGTSFGVGAPVTVTAPVTDPGVNDTITCSIDWGDGTVAAGSVSAGACHGSHAYSAVGQPVIAVTATDNAGDSGANATVIDVVTGTPAGTTVGSSANPAVTGQPVTFTATTTVGTTGTMKFYDGATLLGSKTVVGGTAALTTAKLAPGSHAVTASYAKTAAATPSVSSVLTQQVDAAATSTTVTSTVNPSVLGQATVVKATVAPTAPGTGLPTGTVDLYDNGTLVGTRTLSKGAGSFSLKPAVGSHSYTATYNGSTAFQGSTTAAAYDQQVDPAATTTVVTSSVNPSVFGQTTSVKAIVKAVAPGAGTPSGTVDLYDNGTLIGSKATTGGAAAFSLKPTVGSHSYTASFSGSANHVASTTAAPLSQVVNVAASKVTLTSSAATTTAGKTVTITASVLAVAPGTGVATGSVELFDGATSLGTFPMVSGKAKLATTFPVGVHTLTATYSGDGNFAGSSTATALTQTVN